MAYAACCALNPHLILAGHPFVALELTSGLFVGTLLLTERRHWPYLFVAALPAGMIYYLLSHYSYPISLLLYGVDCLEALAGALLVQRFVAQRPALGSLREVAGFTLYSALLSTTINATINAAVYTFLPATASSLGYWDRWLLCWSGDLLGILVLAPVLLVWLPSLRKMSLKNWTVRHTEALVSFAALVLVSILVLVDSLHPDLDLKYILIPMVVWAAFRFGMPGATLASLVTALAAAGLTAHGYSDISVSNLDPHRKYLAVQLYVLSVVFSALVPALILSARKIAEDRYAALVQTSLDGFWLIDLQGRFINVNEAYCRLTGYSREELLAMRVRDIEALEAPAETSRHIRQIQELGYIRFETRHRTRDNRLLDVDVSATYIAEADGRAFVMLRDITPRKQMEEALRRERDFSTTALSTVASLVIVFDTEARIVSFNKACERCTGYSFEEVRGKAFLEKLLLPKEKDTVMRVWNQLLTTALPSHFVNCWVSKSGRRRLIEWDNTTLKKPDGSVEYILSTGVDITERKEAEEALRQSEQRFRAIFDEAPLGVGLRDAHTGAFLEINHAYCAMLGYTREEMLRRAYPEMIHPGDLQADLKQMDLLRQGRINHFHMDKRYFHKDGAIVWVSLTVVPMWRHGEVPTLHLAMVENITRRKTAEEALRQSEQRFHAIFDEAPLGIGLLDSHTGVFLEINRSYCEMLGYTKNEMLNLTFQKITHPEDLQEDLEQLELLLQGKIQTYHMDKRYFRKDGGTVWVSLTVVPMWRPGEHPTFHLAMVADISRRKLAEDVLREADRRKDEFLALLGHELRNPLAPIRTASHFLKMVSVSGAREQQAVAIIERQTSHLSRIVDDLLDVSRIARGKIALCKARLDWAAVIRSTVEDYRDEIESRGLALELSLPAAPVWIEGDATRLAQIVSNLLNNAQKFTDSGGCITVEMQAPPGTTAALVVRDTGIGMTHDTLEKIFEPFVQGCGGLSQYRRSGLGLGLALVKGLVLLHGGTVRAASSGLGCGSSIVITLPLAEAPSEANHGKGAAREQTRQQRILVIEDNTDAAESLRMFLELKGHEVQMAADGATACAIAKVFKPQIILCDIGLPGEMDGYGVARALRAEPSMHAARMIALTGFGQEEDKRNALIAGFDTHLIKPVDLAVLERVLSEHPAAPKPLSASGQGKE